MTSKPIYHVGIIVLTQVNWQSQQTIKHENVPVPIYFQLGMKMFQLQMKMCPHLEEYRDKVGTEYKLLPFRKSTGK